MIVKRARTVKGHYDTAVKMSISMPRKWYETGCDRQQILGYSTFSDYIQHLVRQDVMASEVSIPIPGLPKHLQPKKKKE